MAAVELQFLPPDEDGITTLYVEEASSQGGPYSQIQSFSAGIYPDYITRAVVTTASSTTNWFRIRWQDSFGRYTSFSDPIQGGTTTIVSKVMNRTILRDSSIDALVAGQEAEVVISEYFGVVDPYAVSPTLAPPRILAGLTLLTLARLYALRLIEQGSTHDWSAGLITMSITSNEQAWKQINRIIELANRDLNRNYSAILLMKEIAVAGGQKKLKVYDVSRSMIELA